MPGDRLDFAHRRGVWTLRLPRPAVDRMEYLFELHHPNDARETVTDPGNGRRVPGAFGDKSVIEFPGYRAPSWLADTGVEARTDAIEVPSRHLGASLHGAVWTPAGLNPDVPAPLLVVNDGAEYAWLASITHFVGVQIARRPAAAGAGGAAGARGPQPLVCRLPGLRPRAGRRGHPRAGLAGTGHRPDRGRGQPGRARAAARPPAVPGGVRRAVPAVGQLLRGRPWTPRSGGSPGSARSPGSWPTSTRRSPTRIRCR